MLNVIKCAEKMNQTLVPSTKLVMSLYIACSIRQIDRILTKLVENFTAGHSPDDWQPIQRKSLDRFNEFLADANEDNYQMNHHSSICIVCSNSSTISITNIIDSEEQCFSIIFIEIC